MALSDNLPVSEALGVFVGVAGFDLLSDGQAEILKATLCALVAGGVIFFSRKRGGKPPRD